MSITRTRRASRASAFTLVELLVVVGIIAVLIAILMPALRRARQVAQRTQCLAQIRQIGTAYVAQNKGYTPVQVYDYIPNWADPAQYDSPVVPSGAHLNGRSGFAALLPYLGGEKKVFACPVAYEYAWN